MSYVACSFFKTINQHEKKGWICSVLRKKKKKNFAFSNRHIVVSFNNHCLTVQTEPTDHFNR